MSVKSDVSSAHLAMLREKHARKITRTRLRIMLTGADRDGSIGQKIAQHLAVHDDATIMQFNGDVRLPKDITRAPMVECDALIMCHGVSHLDWIEDIPFEKMVETVDVNLTATMALTQEFVRQTIDTAWRKRIIMIGSMAHRMVLNGSAAYCASKAGLAMFARCMAWELAPKGYDVFVIHPSNTAGTPMTDETIAGLQRYRQLSQTEAAAYWNDSPIRANILSTREIAELVCFLLGEHSSYLAGAQLELAGGQR